MIKKCIGCGSILQDKDEKEQGFTYSLEKNLCNRCFRIRNYSEYTKMDRPNSEYIDIIKKINKTNDLVVLVVDIFMIPKDIDEIFSYLNNDILLVLTKRDVLPLSIKNENIEIGVRKRFKNIIDYELVSSVKNYNLDNLYSKINKYKKSKNVYVVGFTNAGKSTLINKIIYNYSYSNLEITTSIMPSTTLDTIKIDITDSLTLIDTPGLLVNNSFMDKVSGKELKKIMPKKEIKPITYQAKEKQYIIVEDYFIMEVEDASFTIYASNSLKVDRKYKINELYENVYNLNVSNQLVIEGLLYINFNKNANIKIYSKYALNIYERKRLW